MTHLERPERLGHTIASNMLVTEVGAVIIIVQNADPPTNEEWDSFLSLLRVRREELPRHKILIHTRGGGPDGPQRERLKATLERAQVRVAVVSDNMKVRFVASMIALFHKNHRAFGTHELRDAYEHLNMTPVERRDAEQTIAAMSAKLA